MGCGWATPVCCSSKFSRFWYSISLCMPSAYSRSPSNFSCADDQWTVSARAWKVLLVASSCHRNSFVRRDLADSQLSCSSAELHVRRPRLDLVRRCAWYCPFAIDIRLPRSLSEPLDEEGRMLRDASFSTGKERRTSIDQLLLSTFDHFMEKFRSFLLLSSDFRRLFGILFVQFQLKDAVELRLLPLLLELSLIQIRAITLTLVAQFDLKREFSFWKWSSKSWTFRCRRSTSSLVVACCVSSASFSSSAFSASAFRCWIFCLVLKYGFEAACREEEWTYVRTLSRIRFCSSCFRNFSWCSVIFSSFCARNWAH